MNPNILLAHKKWNLVQSKKFRPFTDNNGETIKDKNGKVKGKWITDYRHDKNGVDLFKQTPIDNQSDSKKTINNYFIPKDFLIGIMGDSYYFSIPTQWIDLTNVLNFKKHVHYTKWLTHIIAIPKKFILNKKKVRTGERNFYTIGMLTHFTYWVTAIKDWETYKEAEQIIKFSHSRKHPTRQVHLWKTFKKEAIKNKTLHVYHQSMFLGLDKNTKLNWLRVAFRQIHKQTYNEFNDRQEQDNRYYLFTQWLIKSKHFKAEMLHEILTNIDSYDDYHDEWLKVVATFVDTSQPYWATELFKS